MFIYLTLNKVLCSVHERNCQANCYCSWKVRQVVHKYHQMLTSTFRLAILRGMRMEEGVMEGVMNEMTAMKMVMKKTRMRE